MSSKTELQEYFQKKWKTVPKYVTERIGGEQHNPLYEAKLTFNGKEYKAVSNSVKAAENKVAEQILENEQLNKTEKPLTKKFDGIIFVDLDNVPQIKNANIDAKIIGFTSKLSSVYANLKDYKNIEIHTTESCVKNATDVLMVYHITKMLEKLRCKEIVILSRDSFSPSLKDILIEKENLCVRHVSRIEDI